MAVDTRHPDYADRLEEWRIMRDASRGEIRVKESGINYLPMPAAFASMPDQGVAYYAAYQKRAQFPEIVTPTIGGMVGVIHRKEAEITLPDAMTGMWERATPEGLPLEALHRRITTELLTTGRHGLLVDFPEEGADLPYIAGYPAETIINWDDSGDFAVLDESGLFRDGFQWNEEQRFRVLELQDGAYTVTTYRQGVASEPVTPQGRDGAMDRIPFVIMGARDLSPHPENPPLLGVARSALAMYQLSADYRWQLFMTGMETLVIVNGGGEDSELQVGAGVVIQLNGEPGREPDAKYIGPAGTGIEAHRFALADERAAAVQAGARLFESEGRSAESGEALRLRYTAQTATLTTIAQTSAQGLEAALRHAATMMGLNPEEVTVAPNMDFIENPLTPTDAQALVGMWQDGAISYTTLYENLRRGEIASQERDWEQERDLIDQDETGRDDPAVAGLLPFGGGQ